MAEVIRMPLLSDTMKEGVISEWHKKVGDKVKADDTLADVETDKATMEVMGYVEGTLLYIGIEKGKAAKVNDIIAIVGKPGEDFKSLLNETPVNPSSSGNVINPLGEEKGEKLNSEKGSEFSSPNQSSQEIPTEKESKLILGANRVKSSPLARKLASEKGIDINKVKGTGDDGRIIKKDINSTEYSSDPAPNDSINKETLSFTPSSISKEEYLDRDLSQMRKTIARRLSESKFTAPHFYLKSQIRMDLAINARKALNEVSPVKISFNDLIIKASASALRVHPEVNSSWMGNFIREYQHIHIGTAVAMEEGLIVPVIRFADQKTLSQIAFETKQLYEKVHSKKIQPQDFIGNTFTISNLGMLDIDEFTAIINPPDACILAIGKIKEVPFVDNGQLKIANVMNITLSCDHRIVDGAMGARFIKTLKGFLENPVTMLI